jgi:hypothetical protein
MARCPIVRPETVRVTLADGEWLELAKELTAGEYRDMLAAQFKDAPNSENGVGLDLTKLGMNKLLAYVKNWSFIDTQDMTLPITEDWLKKFDQQTFEEVLEAVNAHHNECEKVIGARKNGRAGAKNS